MTAKSYKYSADLDETLALGQAFVDRLSRLEYDHGKRIKEGAVYACWATPDDVAEFPSIAVLMADEGVYDEAGFVPSPLEDRMDDVKTGESLVLWQDSEFVCDVQLIISCSDPIQRAFVVRAVREALQDKDGTHYGAFLPIPRYFGGVFKAVVSPRSVRYEDSEDEAEKRIRNAVIAVNCRFPVLRAEPASMFTDIIARVSTTFQMEDLTADSSSDDED